MQASSSTLLPVTVVFSLSLSPELFPFSPQFQFQYFLCTKEFALSLFFFIFNKVLFTDKKKREKEKEALSWESERNFKCKFRIHVNFQVQIFPFFKILDMGSKGSRSIGMTVLKNIYTTIYTSIHLSGFREMGNNVSNFVSYNMF